MRRSDRFYVVIAASVSGPEMVGKSFARFANAVKFARRLEEFWVAVTIVEVA